MRYLQVTDGIATCEVEGGAMPPVVAECLDCLSDPKVTNGQTWNPQTDAVDGLAAWQAQHAKHVTRLKKIIAVSDQPLAKIEMAYDDVTATFATVTKGTQL